MAFGTVNTILNTAPLIIQGATKLVRLLRERRETESVDRESPVSTPVTLEELGNEMSRIHARLDANNQSDIEQIKMIEELARQNEILARSQSRTIKLLRLLSAIAIIALILCLYLLVKSL
ncbi:MAG TPA: hypothetical protein VLN56_00195 [Gammaproteobacteria bacterium]|nr:hypothetical protein [Gammaproteobacteria bacterium]